MGVLGGRSQSGQLFVLPWPRFDKRGAWEAAGIHPHLHLGPRVESNAAVSGRGERLRAGGLLRHGTQHLVTLPQRPDAAPPDVAPVASLDDSVDLRGQCGADRQAKGPRRRLEVDCLVLAGAGPRGWSVVMRASARQCSSHGSDGPTVRIKDSVLDHGHSRDDDMPNPGGGVPSIYSVRLVSVDFRPV
jgi:hypothetical protein